MLTAVDALQLPLDAEHHRLHALLLLDDLTHHVRVALEGCDLDVVSLADGAEDYRGDDRPAALTAGTAQSGGSRRPGCPLGYSM
jgi:hypothetical protein